MNLPRHPVSKVYTPRLACVLVCILLAGCASSPEVTPAAQVVDAGTEAVSTPPREQGGMTWTWGLLILCGLVILMLFVDQRQQGDGEADPQAKRWFRANLKVILSLLSIWAFVSFGCGILFAPWLNQFQLPGTGYKLGFWFAQQGSIYVFVLLIFAYVVIMNRLDRRYGVEED